MKIMKVDNKDHNFYNYHYIAVNAFMVLRQSEMAEYCGMSVEEYTEMSLKWGGFPNTTYGFFFKTRYRAQKMLNELEPYLIMAELMRN